MAAGSVAETAVEAVAEAAEIVSDESAQVAEVARFLSEREIGLVFGGACVGVAVGFAGGYFIFRKRMRTKFQEVVTEEVDLMRKHYNAKLRLLEGEGQKEILIAEPDPADIAEVEDISADREYKGRDDGGPVPYHTMAQSEEEKQEVKEPQTQNIFEETDAELAEEDNSILHLNSDWDYEKELTSRDPKLPYIVHKDEHDEENDGFDKYTFIYYEGDDVLADDRDKVYENKDEVVGIENLARFGHGSGDPNVVYIRNEVLKVDIEICRSEGKYAMEVAGFKENELEHSSMRRRSPRRSEFDDSDR